MTLYERSIAEDNTNACEHGHVPTVRITVLDVVHAAAERLKTGDPSWLEICLIRNTEQEKRDEYQAECHEPLPRSA